ncbi:hypothetical protein DC498_22390 [Terrimonas sp.]|uniref:DoxX family protein n=1 Tax=Terrimonas sp. TaxID=1914338 RepID=UPI000D505F27|nr:hypothetical protein [Terrimonas sp.]PVD49722.1 hypothetical protein DC498_23515 [Terrimonas sp.]PVD49964.1 hypothetical protein DC498_22390 [Terrimonas sp.]
MKPLIILILVFGIALLSVKTISGNYDPAFSARIAMSAMLLFTAIAHFAFSKGMEMMLPGFIPAKKAVVYFTGLIEIAAAIGLQVSNLITTTGWLLILFFILILPANIYAAIKKVDYQKATAEGAGKKYLWFRIPLQIFFIAWIYFSAIDYH